MFGLCRMSEGYSDSQNKSENSPIISEEETSEDSQPLIRRTTIIRDVSSRSVTSRPSAPASIPTVPSSGSFPSTSREAGTARDASTALRLQEEEIQWAISSGLKEEMDRCMALIIQEDEQAGPFLDRWTRARAKAPRDERGNFRSCRFLDPDNHHWCSVRWADTKENEGPFENLPDGAFLQKAYEKRFDIRAGVLYGFGDSLDTGGKSQTLLTQLTHHPGLEYLFLFHTLNLASDFHCTLSLLSC